MDSGGDRIIDGPERSGSDRGSPGEGDFPQAGTFAGGGGASEPGKGFGIRLSQTSLRLILSLFRKQGFGEAGGSVPLVPSGMKGPHAIGLLPFTGTHGVPFFVCATGSKGTF